MEDLKILDELLKYLVHSKETLFPYIRNEANNKSKILKNLPNSIFKAALIKLVKEGYVNQTSEQSIDRLFPCIQIAQEILLL